MVVNQEKNFYLSNGSIFSNLKTFAKSLKDMPEHVYNSHVNTKKNDFAKWTQFSMNNQKLAKAIDGQITKLEMELELLRHLVHESKNKPKTKKKTTSKSKK